MWGISNGYAKALYNIGIESVKDLAHADKWKLKRKFGVMGEQIFYHAWGIDYSVISEKVGAREKSFSKGQILLRDYYREDEVIIVIKEMTEDVAMRLRQHGLQQQGLRLASLTAGILRTAASGINYCFQETQIRQLNCVSTLSGCLKSIGTASPPDPCSVQ